MKNIDLDNEAKNIPDNELEDIDKDELYNLENDPGETTDLAGEYPELVREMDSIMKVSRTHHAIWDFSSGNS